MYSLIRSMGVDYKRPIDYSLVCNNLAMDDLRLQMQATTVVINGETVISTGDSRVWYSGSEK